MKNPLSRAFTTASHRLMIVSAKGGVGKSTITVNLAAALSAIGLRVGIFDSDIHGPNIPALLGIRQKRDLIMGPNPLAMVPIEARPEALDRRPVKPYTRYGIEIMSLALIVGETQMINPEPGVLGPVVSMMLARVEWGNLDVLLLDMPPGTGDPLQTVIREQLADGALLIATRERLAHLDNGRLLSFLISKRVRIPGIVENMTHLLCPKCGERVELYPAPAAKEAVYGNIPVIASLPFHPDLIRDVRGGPPLPLAEPDTPVARELIALARQVADFLNRP